MGRYTVYMKVADKVFVADGMILGIDEVGRGPAAGPVTVGAVILPEGCEIKGLNDSKLLSQKERLELECEIKLKALAVAVGWASSIYIDEHGLTKALGYAAQQAIEAINSNYDLILIDGNHNYLTSLVHTEPMVKADQSVACVAAASIVAKVARDRFMELHDNRYPQYGFASHKGYLTRSHISAIRRHGLSPIHRKRWSINVTQSYHI